jgi:hypothetical protein
MAADQGERLPMSLLEVVRNHPIIVGAIIGGILSYLWRRFRQRRQDSRAAWEMFRRRKDK